MELAGGWGLEGCCLLAPGRQLSLERGAVLVSVGQSLELQLERAVLSFRGF